MPVYRDISHDLKLINTILCTLKYKLDWVGNLAIEPI